MAWLILSIASIFEVVWAVGIKYTEGFSKPIPTVITLGAMAASVYLLSVSMRSLPVGTSYAVWTGLGSVGTVICGIFLFGEGAQLSRLLCIAMIIAGILGLRLTSDG